VTAPGLESLTASELTGLGLVPTHTEVGGVSFEGSLEDVARANLWLRTASRVLARVSSFRARALGEVERKVATVPWSGWLVPGLPVHLRVSSRKSRLYHQRAVAERIGRALAAAGWEVATSGGGQPRGSEDFEGSDPTPENEPGTQLLIVRLFRDVCAISLDTSGALLHRRGYRLATGKAPLRETLAAALLLASGWDPATPLVDPLAGSGTIPIEAALLARRIPPGRHRSFAFQRWPAWRPEQWRALLEAADGAALSRVPAPIVGADRDAGAVAAAEANAARAGVTGDVTWLRSALSSLAAPPGPGALVSNPPYGVRLGEQRELRNLYARLGQLARRDLPGWIVALLVPSVPLERQTGLSWHELFRTRNGGLEVRAITARTSAAGTPPKVPSDLPAGRGER
jgi:putative N6-adenine-specific DNA methylase